MLMTDNEAAGNTPRPPSSRVDSILHLAVLSATIFPSGQLHSSPLFSIHSFLFISIQRTRQEAVQSARSLALSQRKNHNNFYNEEDQDIHCAPGCPKLQVLETWMDEQVSVGRFSSVFTDAFRKNIKQPASRGIHSIHHRNAREEITVSDPTLNSLTSGIDTMYS